MAYKLSIGVGLIILVALAMGYVGYYSLHEVDREVSQMNEIKEVEKKLLLASKFAEQYHSKQEQGLVNKINDELSEATRMANDLHEILHSEEDKEIVGNVTKDIELYKDVFGRTPTQDYLKKPMRKSDMKNWFNLRKNQN